MRQVRSLTAAEWQRLRFALPRLERRNITDGNAYRRHRLNHLHRLIALNHKHGSQRFMPAEHLRQHAFQCLNLKPPGETYREWHVVRRAARIELVQEPETLLSE